MASLATYTEEFKTEIAALKTKSVGNIVKVFESVGQKIIDDSSSKATKKTTKTTKAKKSSSPKALTWNQLWAKKEIGGKDFFENQYKSIKEETGEKNHFAMLKRLRDWAETTTVDGCDHTEWERWHRHVHTVMPDDAPKDPPSERKEK